MGYRYKFVLVVDFMNNIVVVKLMWRIVIGNEVGFLVQW